MSSKLEGVQNNDNIRPKIKAMEGLRNKTMIELNNWSSLINLEIHANRVACIGVKADNKEHIRIEKCTIHKTTNSFTENVNFRPHLIFLNKCKNATVTSNILRRAGCEPKLNATLWNVPAAGIYAPLNRDLRIMWNDIAYTLTAGIDFTGSVGVDVFNNTIQKTAQNKLYKLNSSIKYLGGDGITAYHNQLQENVGYYQYLDYWITNNKIFNYMHHGIHVSGRDVHIENNTISPEKPYEDWVSCSSIEEDQLALYTQYAIILGDQRDNLGAPDCSSMCTIKGNSVKNGYCKDYSIRVFNYKSNGVDIANNKGENSINWSGKNNGNCE